MGQSRRRAIRPKRRTESSATTLSGYGGNYGKTSKGAIKNAEEIALATFGSGLRLAAALGTVAAKTTSLALASLATGADKFSELVRKEAFAPTRPSSPYRDSPKSASNKKRSGHAKKRR